MAYWLLLIFGMASLGIALINLFSGNYFASTPTFLLAILMVLLAIATRKDKA